MTHTPAPWEDGKTADSIIAQSDLCCADIKEYYGGYVVAESIESRNKPLIKAAPELLAVCKALVEPLAAGLFLRDDGTWICGYCTASTIYASSDVEHRHDCAIWLARNVIASVMGEKER